MKDMRNVIIWQIWIEHSMQHFPFFVMIQHDAMKHSEKWKSISEHFYNSSPLEQLNQQSIGIYDMTEEKDEALKDFETFKKFLN